MNRRQSPSNIVVKINIESIEIGISTQFGGIVAHINLKNIRKSTIHLLEKAKSLVIKVAGRVGNLLTRLFGRVLETIIVWLTMPLIFSFGLVILNWTTSIMNQYFGINFTEQQLLVLIEKYLDVFLK